MRDTIEIEREAFGRPAAGSLLLHVAVVGVIALLMLVNSHFHGNEWSSNAPPGAIQATLVSSAPAIPLPQVAPPTPNVLATQLPSPSPAPPSKATIPIQEPDAVPIPERHPRLRRTPKGERASPPHAQPLNQPNRANFGEAAPTQLAHAMTSAAAQGSSPVTVNSGDFASRYPWYVAMITRMVQQYWYTQDIAGNTPFGSQVAVTFSIDRAGRVSSIRISQASSSPTLNMSAMQAVQRVESFGPLPSQYTGNNVSVEYTFTYDQPSR